MVYTDADKKGLVPKGQMPAADATGIPSFDLSKINVVQLARDLSVQINKEQPKGWLRKWWANQKLPMDNQRLSHLNDYINEIKRVNSSITEMQTELFVQPKILERLIEKRYAEAKNEIELQKKRHELEIKQLNEAMHKDELDTEKLRAELKDLASTTRITDLKGDMLQKMIDSIDFKNPTAEQVYMVTKILDPSAPTDLGDAVKKPLIEELKRKMEQETRIYKSKADLETERAKYQKRMFEDD